VVLLVHLIFVLIQCIPLPLQILRVFQILWLGLPILAFTASQVVYEYTSAAANNGSGFEGLLDNTLWWNLTTIVSLLGGRYIPIVPSCFWLTV